MIADINTKIEILDKENNEVNITGAGAGSVIYQPVIPSGGSGYVTIPVRSITVTSTGGADAITANNGTLQMIAAVMPAYATNNNISWSVINGTGSASIDSSGLLKAITNGTVTVKAKAKDGSGVYGEKEIIISGQTYTITKTDVIGGTAKVTVDKDTAKAGETVTVEISEIETGKQFKSIAVTGTSGAVAVKEVVPGSEYTFTMPDEAVTVSVTLENIPVVACPPLVNGLSFSDDNSNDTNTIIKLGAPSEAGDTFVYKISDNDSEVPTSNVGDDLSSWIPVINGTSITAANGKHIGVAEVKNYMAVQFSDATAVTENENPPDISVDNVNIINQHTVTFKSTDVDSIKVDDVDVAMSGITVPYAEYANGTYTVNLAEPLTVGSHTITLTKSGYPAKTVTAGYFGKIERDPGNTGGNVTTIINGNTITFSGEIAFYGADASLGRNQGHRVGVKVTAPAGMTDVKGTATLTIGDKTYAAGTNWMDGDNYFYYYPLVTLAGQAFTFTVKWDGTDATADVFTIKIDGNATLEGEIGEPNNDKDHAAAITVNAGSQTQWIYPSTDEDWFKFEAQSGTLYKIQTSNLYPDSNDNMSYEVDTVIYIYDKDGNKLYENDDDVSDPDYGYSSRIDFLCNESGTYYVKVVDYSNSDLDSGTQENYVGQYDIAVTRLTGVTAAPTIQEISFDNNNHVNVKGTSEAGARVFLTGSNGCYCNALADNSGSWEFNGLNLYIGDIIDVTAIAENKSISTAATATIIDIAQETVNEVAAGITTIIPPEKDATTLTLPGVPEGYTIKIKSSSNIGGVKVDGTVIPQKFTCVVSLMLTVTSTSTGRWADTNEITVIIPQSSVGDEIGKITGAALGTITVGDTQTVLERAQALVSDGYIVTVKAADGTFINASGVAIAAGNGSITFTVAQDAGKINPADTNPIAITVNAASNKDQTAPEGLMGVVPTTAANDDGKITGTTIAMEYKLVSGVDSTYAACGEGETAGLAAGIYDVRYTAKTGFNASPITEVIIPNQDQAAPTGLMGVVPTTAANNDGKITGTTAAMEYKLASADEGTYAACKESETIGLEAGTYDVRYAAKTGFYASPITEVIVPNQDQSAPSGLTGVMPTTAANIDGKITGTTTAMEYKLASADDSTYAACEDGETTDLAVGTYNVRYAVKPGFNAGVAAEVTIPFNTAPAGLTGVAPTTFNGNDGKITGTTTAMEYKLASAADSTYIACGDGEITGLAVGTYSVRYAAKDGSDAGTAVNIIIPYNVASAGDLDNVRNNLNGNYIQTADIDLSGYSNWNPIGTNNNILFSGSYNGNGYKISNLTATGISYMGLFGCVSGQLENINLDNVSITAAYDANVGSHDIGGLAGYLEGTIKNSHVTGCNISGYCDVGGLIGCNWQGSVEECSASGTVTTSSGTGYKESVGGLAGRNNGYIVESFAVADVSGDAYCTGGLAGNNEGGTIDKCYAAGSVTTTVYWVGGLVGDNRKFNGADSIIKESYATGTVSGDLSGGLVGFNNGNNDAGTIELSYYDQNTTTQSDTGKGIPESTADMMKQATFNGWDFNGTWTINEGTTYPVLLSNAAPNNNNGAASTIAPPLVNGLSFSDDDTNDTNTIITLGAPTDAGNTFVYKISDDNNAVPAPNVGDDLNTWIKVTNGTSITAANGKHIGVAEVNNNMAVQFSDAAAVTEAEPINVTASSSGVISATGMTIITLGEVIPGLTTDDIVVKVNGIALDNSGNDKYTISGLDITNITIKFLAGAALNYTSVISVEMIKSGYIINDGNPIIVTNTIMPVIVPAATLDYYSSYPSYAVLTINFIGLDVNPTFNINKITYNDGIGGTYTLKSNYLQTELKDPNSYVPGQYYYDSAKQQLAIILTDDVDANDIYNYILNGNADIATLSAESGWCTGSDGFNIKVTVIQ